MQIIQRDSGVILRSGESLEILLINDNQLPTVSPERHFWQSCVTVNAAFLSDYSLNLLTIRPLQNNFVKHSDDMGEMQSVYMMRYLDGAIPDNACWCSVDEMPSLDITMPITKEDILSAIQSKTVPEWYRFDWYDEFTLAIQSITEDSLQQIRSWERSAIWRIPSSEGETYLKFLPPMFKHEVVLSTWLSQRFPQKSPEMLSSPIPGTMRMADYGQLDVMSCKDLDIWRDAIQGYAELQVALIEHNPELREISVPERGLDWIAEKIEAFLMDDTNLSRGVNPLNEEDIANLQSAIPRLMLAIDALRVSPIPETLEHGDLWAGQMIVHDGCILITDWSDSAITFPFFSLPFFLTEIESNLADYPDAKSVLEDAYLSQWLNYGDMATLKAILASANLVSNIYTALRYHYDILPAMGQKWEMESMIAYDMRLLLAKLSM